MQFLDECQIRAEAGNGGNGAMAFRREKFLPFGGPAGGDGGRGGDVVLIGDAGKSTLVDVAHQRLLRAEKGENGSGRDCHGHQGRSLSLHVPLGTIVHDADTGERVGELLSHGQALVIAQGGAGGRGNKHFATPTDRAPRRAEPGGKGKQRNLRLELKVMADVGLLGLPNVGKSTLISSVSRARPKVADYPFTTLTPHLGVVTVGDPWNGHGFSFVLADIPGLVPGASQGVGLGIRFLKHVERTRLLLHLITLSDEPGRDPSEDYRALRHELECFSPELAARPEVVALNRADLPEVREAYDELRTRFEREHGRELHLISAATKAGVDELLARLVEQLRLSREAAADPLPQPVSASPQPKSS